MKHTEETQRAVLCALLDILHEQEFVDNNTYEGTNRLLHSAMDLPEFFWPPVCHKGREGVDDEYTQNP